MYDCVGSVSSNALYPRALPHRLLRIQRCDEGLYETGDPKADDITAASVATWALGVLSLDVTQSTVRRILNQGWYSLGT